MDKRNTTPDMRQLIRQQVTPFGGFPPDEKVYPAKWIATPHTFSQITDELWKVIVKSQLWFAEMPLQDIVALLQHIWVWLWAILYTNLFTVVIYQPAALLLFDGQSQLTRFPRHTATVPNRLPHKVTNSSFPDTFVDVPLAQQNQATHTEVQYPTVWGCLTFAELYIRTHRYVAHLLYQDSRFDPDTLEDGLQVGYLTLWQRLQTEPTLLAEHKIGWIAKFIFYSAVHTRQKEQRITKRQLETTDGIADSWLPHSATPQTHSYETRQTDKRIDLQAAIVAAANHILAQPSGLAQDRALWALYATTSLQIQVTAASKLFDVHHRAMKQAYEQVLSFLQQCLPGYAPSCKTRPIRARTQEPLPYQDLCAIREQNATIEPEYFEKVQQLLLEQTPDTLNRDLIALQGIREQISAKEQARLQGISYSSMQRAYERIHLLLAAQRDTSVIPRRIQKIRAKPFVFRSEDTPIIQQVANDLLSEPHNDGKLIALYSYLCNISTRASARNFQMSESTLRNYRHQIQERFAILMDKTL